VVGVNSVARRWRAAVIGLALAFSVPSALAVDVLAEALLPGMAVLLIDGQRVTLRAGQSHGSVRLLEVGAQAAVIEIDGKAQRVGMSQRVSGSYRQPERREVRVQRNAQLQYITTAEINGRRTQVLIDTGANLVALNAAEAVRLGIGEEEGIQAPVQTASDVRMARQVMLDSVSVGGIHIEAVQAVVMDGAQPAMPLLGMSFLRHVSLAEEGGVLSLSAKW
jgi:aspartyl protease family protein